MAQAKYPILNALIAPLVLACMFSAPLRANAKGLKLVEEGHYAISTSLLQRILAKEICSCVFVSQVGGPNAPDSVRAQKCLERSELPLTPSLISALLHQHIDPKTKEIEITPKLLGAVLGLFQGQSALAEYRGPKQGCALMVPAK